MTVVENFRIDYFDVARCAGVRLKYDEVSPAFAGLDISAGL